MNPIELIIGLAVVAFAIALIASKSFRDQVLVVLRVKSDAVLSAATTPIQREQDDYNNLKSLQGRQVDSVQNVMAFAVGQKRLLDEKNAALAQAKTNYFDGKELGMQPDQLQKLALKVTEAEDAVKAQNDTLSQATAAADRARVELESTNTALQQYASKIDQDRNTADLTKAITVASQARQFSTDINSALSKSNAAHQQVQAALDKANAGAELSQGDQTEAQLNKLRQDRAAQAAMERLDAEHAKQ